MVTYSYQKIVDGAMRENQFVKKNRIKYMFIGIVYAAVPLIVLGMILVTALLGSLDDGKYTIEIKPYQELTSPYTPYPALLGQDLPQIWEIQIRNGRQFGTSKFLDFRQQGCPDSLRITLAEYKQLLIDNDIFKQYAWGNNYQRRNE